MRRHAQTALLVLLGGMLVKLVVTDAHLRYVRGGYAPLLVLTGAALLVVAAVNLWRDLRADAITRDDDTTATGLRLDGIFGFDRQRAARAAPEPARDAGDHRHRAGDHRHRAGGHRDWAGDHRDRALAAGRAAAAHEGLGESPVAGAGGSEPAGMYAPTAAFETVRAESVRTVSDAGPAPAPDPQSAGQPPGPIDVRPRTGVGWALLAAALAVLVLSPPALGSFPVVRAGALDPTRPVGAIPDGDPVPMSLADYAAHAAAGGQALVGRQVRLVGFVVAGPRGEPYLARLAVGCCAAGARPVKLGLTGDLPGVLTADTWVEVVGVYSDQVGRDPVSGAAIPSVSVVDVTAIDPPADPYES